MFSRRLRSEVRARAEEILAEDADDASGAELLPLAPRPRTRGDCAGGSRPCPWISCRHHLYLDVDSQTGAVKLNFPDADLSDLRETCSLDVADRGGVTLDVIGQLLNVTHEAARLTEVRALLKLKMTSRVDGELGGRPTPRLGKANQAHAVMKTVRADQWKTLREIMSESGFDHSDRFLMKRFANAMSGLTYAGKLERRWRDKRIKLSEWRRVDGAVGSAEPDAAEVQP